MLMRVGSFSALELVPSAQSQFAAPTHASLLERYVAVDREERGVSVISSSLSAAIVVDYFSHKLILHPAASFIIAAVRPVHCATARNPAASGDGAADVDMAT